MSLYPVGKQEQIDLEHERAELLHQLDAVERRLGYGVRDYTEVKARHEWAKAVWVALTLEVLHRLGFWTASQEDVEQYILKEYNIKPPEKQP